MGANLYETTSVRVKLLNDKAKVPTYGSNEAAGADLHAVVDGEITICAGEQAIVPTGIAIELNTGTEAQVRPRSGLAAKHGITVVNTPGTIDSDYRGEIKVILRNTNTPRWGCWIDGEWVSRPYREAPFLHLDNSLDFKIKTGDRIAQMVIAPVIRGEFSVAESLDETVRGEGGFGSTGV